MNEVSKKQRTRRRLGLFLGLGALMATSAVFGAARLYDRYTVRVEWNGQVYEGVAEVDLGGTASMDLALDGCEGTVFIQPAGEDGMVNVTVECEPTGEACNVGTLAAPDGVITIDCNACPEDGCEVVCDVKSGT